MAAVGTGCVKTRNVAESGGYLDPYPIGDRGLQSILRDRILRTEFRAEFSHTLGTKRPFVSNQKKRQLAYFYWLC